MVVGVVVDVVVEDPGTVEVVLEDEVVVVDGAVVVVVVGVDVVVVVDDVVVVVVVVEDTGTVEVVLEDEVVVVVVAIVGQSPFVMVLVSRVTAPFRANNCPCTVAPLFAVMDVKAKM